MGVPQNYSPKVQRPVEVFGELEMLQCWIMFFDRAIYYAAVGL